MEIDKDENVENWEEEEPQDLEEDYKVDKMATQQLPQKLEEINLEIGSNSSQSTNNTSSFNQSQNQIQAPQQLSPEEEERNRQIISRKIDQAVQQQKEFLQEYQEKPLQAKLALFQGGITIIRDKLWTGNPQDRISQAFTTIGFFVINLHFFFVVGEWYKQNYGISSIQYGSLVPILIIGYNVYRCFVTEPGFLPMGNLEGDPTQLDEEEILEFENQKNQQQQQEQQEQLKNGNCESGSKNGFSNNHNNEHLLNESAATLASEYETLSEENNIMLQKRKQNVNLKMYQYRYCKTCKILRPPKASHCQRCNMCVQTYDHHCFFIGNCVGSRNIQNFMYFLGTTMVYGFINMALTIFMGYVQITSNEHLLETINRHTYARNFFYFALFCYLWGQMCGCPRRMYRMVTNLFGFSLAILIFYVGTDLKKKNGVTSGADGESALLADGELLNQEKQKELIFESMTYIWNPISALVQMVLNMAALGVATPLGCQTLFNVTHGITKKEKHHLDDETKYKFSYDMSTKEQILNFIEFVKQKQPKSLLYSNN